MECENVFCIYNKNLECSLNKISLDNLGICNECILTIIDNDILRKNKNIQLNNLEKDFY